MSEKSFIKTVLVQQCSLLAAEIFFVDSESKTFFPTGIVLHQNNRELRGIYTSVKCPKGL
jgi:hypothetical protein